MTSGAIMSKEEIASTLTGLPVLSVISNLQSGSLIELGTRRPISRPVDNSQLTDDQRLFEGSHSIYITCVWELVCPSEWREKEPLSNAELLPVLDLLVGSAVEAADIRSPLLDLFLHFANAMELTVMPSQNSQLPGYTMRIDRSYWVVYAGGRTRQLHCE